MFRTVQFIDNWNIAKKISLFKAWNLLQLRASYRISKWRKKSTHKGLPYALSIEPTTACNLACPECPSGLKQFSRKTGKIDLKGHEILLAEVQKSVFYINYYFQGEPFLHPQFLELIKAAKKKNMYTSTSTNAHFITPEKALNIVDSGLDRLLISIDGLTQKSYESYRVNGQLEKVLLGTKLLVEAKNKRGSKTPYLIFQFLATKANEQDIPRLKDVTKEMKVDELRIKTAQFYNYEEGNPLMPTQEKYARYKLLSNGKYALKYKTDDSCWRMWSSAVLTWDAKVVPCCFDKDAKYQLGDAYQSGVFPIWKSPQYNTFRQAILTDRQGIDICTNCSEGAKVWA